MAFGRDIMAGSSASAAPFPPSSPISDSFAHAGPTSLHVITTAASLHLGTFLRRRVEQAFLLPSSPTFHFKHISHLGHLACLRDEEHERTFARTGFNMLQWSRDAISGTCISFFFGEDGNRNDSSSGGKTYPQFFSNGRKWTDTLLAVNVGIYIADLATRRKLLVWGAKINNLIDNGQLWRLATSSFLHANIWHLMVNCFSLYSIGPAVEQFSGPRRYLAVYMTSAVTSSAMSYWLSKGISVGASGAIFGLAGAYAVYVLRHKEMVQNSDKHLHSIMNVIALNMGLGFFIRGIDKWGHVGGLIGGVATSWLLGPAYRIEYTTGDGKKFVTDRAPIFSIFKQKRSTE